MLRPDDFYSYANAFAALFAVFEATGSFGTFALFEALKSMFYDSAHIGEMIASWKSFASPASVEIQCKAVIDAANKRKLDQLAARIKERKDDDTTETLTEIEDKLEEIKNANSSQDAESLQTTLAEIEKIITGDLPDFGFPQSRYMSNTCAMSPGSVTVVCGTPGASKSFFGMECLWKWDFAEVPVSSLQLEKNFSFQMRRAIAQIGNCPGMTSNRWIKENPELARDAIEKTIAQAVRLEDRRVFQVPQGKERPTRTYILRWIRREIARGMKILLIDPISIMSPERGGMRWNDEELLLEEISQIVRRHPIRIIFVTHPKNGIAGSRVTPALNSIQGTAHFSRFVDSVFWLDIHDEITTMLQGPQAETYNRTMYFLKCKLGPGEGKKIAMKFDGANLCCRELGELPRE